MILSARSELDVHIVGANRTVSHKIGMRTVVTEGYRGPMATLEIRELGPADEGAFLDGLRSWGEDTSWHSFAWDGVISYVELLAIHDRERRGEGLAEGWVPHTMLYGFADGVIVGRCSIRHELNPYLRSRGGHIGYGVAPQFRRRGFATELFAAGRLFAATQLGLEQVLVSCDADNVGSRRLIEGAGGVLEAELESEGVLLRRYWVPTGR